MDGDSHDVSVLHQIAIGRAENARRAAKSCKMVPAAMLGHPLQEVAGTAWWSFCHLTHHGKLPSVKRMRRR